MAEETPFSSKHILHYFMYIALIAICMAGILYLLMHARPQIAPSVKHDSSSQLLRPQLQSAGHTELYS